MLNKIILAVLLITLPLSSFAATDETRTSKKAKPVTSVKQKKQLTKQPRAMTPEEAEASRRYAALLNKTCPSCYETLNSYFSAITCNKKSMADFSLMDVNEVMMTEPRVEVLMRGQATGREVFKGMVDMLYLSSGCAAK